MPYTVSPAVMITEIDQTQIVGVVSSTVAAFAGDFQWGPCFTPRLIDSEQALIQTYWKPNDRVATDFFTAWNFLNYGDSLQLVRICNTTANTAKNACSANSTGPQILNDAIYEHSYLDGSLDTEFSTGEFVAAYPGSLGNSLKVWVCPSTNAYSRTLTGTFTCNTFSKIVRGTGSALTTQAVVGDHLRLNGEIHQIAKISNTTYLELTHNHILGATSVNTAIRYWQYYNEFNGAPSTTTYASERGSSGDELHIVVTDALGKWSGTPGTILESFGFMSKAPDAKNVDGTTAYYRDVLLQQSKYIRWASHASTMTNAGTSTAASGATVYGGRLIPTSGQLRGGSDGATITNSEKTRGFDLFASAEEIDITLVLGGVADTTLANYLVQNIAETRRDAIAFISVPLSAVVNNVGAEDIDCESFRDQLPSSSYGVLDGNWKYQYDKWHDVYRWMPCNGDIAGLVARTASLLDPWWSPAGYNRGYLKNVTKLAWNPRKAYRDHLYRSQINPIMSDHGSGPLLLGDKTLLTKESAFGYINVRMLFIILEKAIATAAKYQLFEFNDEFSWAAFKNMVEPYLRDVKARRGVRNFKVICDATNNTSQVINSGGFVGDIYILPNRSTQWVLLNFIAVADGVMFTEKTGTS